MSSRDIQVGLMRRPEVDNSMRTPLPIPPAQTRVPTYAGPDRPGPSASTSVTWRANGSRWVVVPPGISCLT